MLKIGEDTYKLLNDEKDVSEKNRIIEQYRPLIESMVKGFSEPVVNFETAKKNGLDADDLRQEAMIALFGALETYNPQSEVSFGLYAKICIKNRLISLLRKKQFDCEELSDENCPMPDVEDNPEERCIGEDSCRQLLKLISEALTEYELKVFNLYLSGKSYREISRITGKSEKSVGNALCRLKSKLKELI